MKTGKVDFESARYVAENMREWDRREIYATRWADSPDDVAADCVLGGTFGWVASAERPVSVVGAMPLHPGVWSVYMFATDEFPAVSSALTKFVKRVMIPALVETGAHRAECKSLIGHEVAHRWLEFLGARRESVLKEYGRGGEDFAYYVWRRG